jgi:hypothetical protein
MARRTYISYYKMQKLSELIVELYPELSDVNLVVSTAEIGVGNLKGAQLRLNTHVWAAARPFVGVLKVSAGRNLSPRTPKPVLVDSTPLQLALGASSHEPTGSALGSDGMR